MEEKYKKMFSRVKASPEKIQEVIAMTEKRKPGRIVRNLLVAAAIMALAVLTAMGANAASGGELFRILSFTEYEENGTHVGEIVVEYDDDVVGEDKNGEYTIVMQGDTDDIEGYDLYHHYVDADGNEHMEELDISGLLERARQVAQSGQAEAKE